MSPQHFVFALVDAFTHMALACAVDSLRIANLISAKELYRWSYASADGAAAVASDGSRIDVQHRFDALPLSDRVFVLSGIDMQHKETSALIAALRRMDRLHDTRIGALCSGAWVLAQGGFLDGRRAAIHWEYHDSFMESFPEVALVRSVFVTGQKFDTASGGTATADLMLHLIAQDQGEDLAQAVADQMVYTAARASTAEQRVSLQSRQGMRNRHLACAIGLMRENLETPLPHPEIATATGISVRQLERLFGKYLNTSPKKYYMELRLDRARNLLVQTEMSVTEVAFACGFESPGHFSRVYRTAFGVNPTLQRTKLT
ncbi:MAG: GlxA family transcriptional regulator [Pseudomonadota bacterium]